MIKQNLGLVVALLSVLIGVLFVNNAIMSRRITERVIQELKRDYVPGPYEPGFDPDTIPPKSPTFHVE
jgi:hypothetical protein